MYSINGFTVDSEYPIIDNGANLVTAFDNNGILRIFNKVEGGKDFKNWFIIVDKAIEIIK